MLKLQREREREREHCSLLAHQKGGQAVGKSLFSLRPPKGGQRYSLNIGGDSYGC